MTAHTRWALLSPPATAIDVKRPTIDRDIRRFEPHEHLNSLTVRSSCLSYMRRSDWKCRQIEVGGVNHCHLHCRLAKFRDLMRRVKYGAVIG